MSTSPVQQEPNAIPGILAASEMETVADQLVALVEEFEAALSEGHVPPAFTERLAQVRQTVERLIHP